VNAESKNQKGKSAAENKRGNSEVWPAQIQFEAASQEAFREAEDRLPFLLPALPTARCDSRARLTGMPPPS
jgi:hypothetical protein